MATGDVYIAGSRLSPSGQAYVRSDDVRGTPEFLALAFAGKVTGIRRVVISGYNSDVDIATAPEDIFPAIESTLIPRVPSTAPESWEIVSNDINDTAAGSGARTVSITTVNASYVEVTQTITLNGTTAVPLTGTHIAVNAALVLTAGSGGTNTGLITIRVAAGGAARAYISPGDSLLNQCKFTVPAGHTLELYSATMGITTSGGSEGCRFIFFNVNSAGRSINAVRLPLFAGGTSLYRHELGSGLIPYNMIAATGEASIRASQVTQNNTQVDAAIIGLLYDSTIWP